MILTVSSADPKMLDISLRQGKAIVAARSLPAERRQAELLLPGIAALLADRGRGLADITAVEVAADGAGFSSLRIGVATANALAYALGVRVAPLRGKALKKKGIRVAAPAYSRPPSIGKKD